MKKLDRRIFPKADVYGRVFSQIVDDWEDKSILDFGGNRGNLISSSEGKIKAKNYTCLDISHMALEMCKWENPGVKTIHWNLYNEDYNVDGNLNEPWPKLGQYDIIFANSVFTHMTLRDTIDCIEVLKEHTHKIVFTYIDPDNQNFRKNFIDKWKFDLPFEDKPESCIIDKDGMFWSSFKTEHLNEHIRFGFKKFGSTEWFNYARILC